MMHEKLQELLNSLVCIILPTEFKKLKKWVSQYPLEENC